MPVAKVYVPADMFTPAQRLAIVKDIHEVEQRPASAPTDVLITDVPDGNWGFSGNIYQPSR